MLPLPAHLLQTVTVRPSRGQSGSGPVYGDPTTYEGLAQDERKLVRTADGKTITSAGFVLLPITADCPAESLVTLADGRQYQAVQVARLDGGGLPTDHLDVTLA